MFVEKAIIDKFNKIFGVKKITMETPSDSFEQDTLFVHINSCKSKVTGNLFIAKVEGVATIYSQQGKIPFGFFQKKIDSAIPAHKDGFFFTGPDTDIESSPARRINICERQCGFVYLHKEQYDPNKGELTELITNMENEE